MTAGLNLRFDEVCHFAFLNEEFTSFLFFSFFFWLYEEFWPILKNIKTMEKNCNYISLITWEAADWRWVSALRRPARTEIQGSAVCLSATETAELDSVCSDSAAPQRSALSDCEGTRLQPPETQIQTQFASIRRQFGDSFKLDQICVAGALMIHIF